MTSGVSFSRECCAHSALGKKCLVSDFLRALAVPSWLWHHMQLLRAFFRGETSVTYQSLEIK